MLLPRVSDPQPIPQGGGTGTDNLPFLSHNNVGITNQSQYEYNTKFTVRLSKKVKFDLGQ